MEQLTEAQCRELRQMLLDHRKRLEDKLADRDHYGLNSAHGDSQGELSAYDNHPADMGTELYERSKDLALLDEDDRHLNRIVEALDAMDEGTYGRCVVCGEPIPVERLYAIPDTDTCVRHSNRHNLDHSRPIEEELLDPPFGRSSLDEQGSYNGFDGEDAWQIVERYGNSNSPALSETPEKFEYERPYFESDENDGYVEDIESFLATDITGNNVTVVRNNEYKRYMKRMEGDPLLEWTDDDLDESRMR